MNTKEELASKIGIDFDEAVELFSEETLNSMQLMLIVGGEEAVNNCHGGNCQSKEKCWCFNFGKCSDLCKSTPTPTPTSTSADPVE
jgi:hypothetical protein